MAYQKGEKVEAGIWHLADKEDLYLAEVNYRHPVTGRRVRERTIADKVDVLRSWRNARRTDALRGEITRRRDAKGKMPFKPFADEYLKEWSKRKKAQLSYERDVHSIKHLKAYFGNREIGNITRRDVEKYINKRMDDGLSPATTNRELSCLKNMFRKAVDWNYLDVNPAWGVTQQKEEPPEFEFLTFEEADALMEKAVPGIRTFVITALNTGMRKGELLKLEWKDVNFKTGIITVSKTKNKETRHIPMNKRLSKALKAHPKHIVNGKQCPLVFCREDGSPLPTEVRRAFNPSLKAAGITDKHIRFHDLRHTFASHLIMRGVDLRTVAKLMGHRDIKMTMRYAHLAPDHLQSAVDALETPLKKQKKKRAG